MTLYLETPSGFQPWAGEAIDEVRHPLDIESLWPDADLAAIALYKPAAADPVPDGKIIVSTSVERVVEVVQFVHVLADVPAPSTDPADYPLLPWQFKAMVMYLGKDADIRAAINTTADGLHRATAMSRYENASCYVYSDPLMQAMRAAVGLSEQELSDAWMQAKDLASA